MITSLGEMIMSYEFDRKVDLLAAMPAWEFCIVMGEGFFDTCAGTTRNGVYYSEQEIYAAYFKRYPDAEALL